MNSGNNTTLIVVQSRIVIFFLHVFVRSMTLFKIPAQRAGNNLVHIKCRPDLIIGPKNQTQNQPRGMVGSGLAQFCCTGPGRPYLAILLVIRCKTIKTRDVSEIPLSTIHFVILSSKF
jgi:hypothetical protein